MEKEKLDRAIKQIKSEIKLEKKDAEEQDEVMGCCDKRHSDGYIHGLEVGLSYLKSVKVHYGECDTCGAETPYYVLENRKRVYYCETCEN